MLSPNTAGGQAACSKLSNWRNKTCKLCKKKMQIKWLEVKILSGLGVKIILLFMGEMDLKNLYTVG